MLAKPLTPINQGAGPETAEELLRAEQIYRKGVTTVLDLIAPAAFKVESKFLELNSQYLATLFVVNYPRYISVGWFSPVINYNATLDVSMFFYPLESSIILKQLRKKVGNLEAQISTDTEKGMPRDPLRETALHDIEELRDDLTQGTEKFFQFALYVTIYADGKEELEKQVARLESLFGSKLIYTKRAFFQAEQAFNSSLPQFTDQLQISFNMNSSPIAASFPFISTELTSNDGILYGINQHNNSLIIFDRFSLTNPNEIVFATSGAGKSYTIKLEILRSLMFGTEVMVIDPENEYRHLAESVGGAFINVSLNSESKINPFDLPRGVGDDSKPANIIREAVITIKGLIRVMIGELSPKEDNILDEALVQTYAKKDINSDSDLSQVVVPTFSDLEDILSGMTGAEDLVLKLQKYTRGTFAGLLNNPSNIDVNNQLVVFSVRDLQDELKPVAIYMIVSYIWNIVRSTLKKRILVVDEAWWLMMREDSAKFIYALVKRCRKYYLGVTTISQDVNDFLPSGVDINKKTFMLTKSERYMLLEANVGECLFFAGNKHVAMLVRASYAEDQIITSDPRQLLEIEQAKREFAAQEAENNKPGL
ncbi:MAG: ATP-binding protein [Candidatus Komeilibacteria bacterium]|nr:ATP-binding protein [Candidatus Komeilibacteria bacterium]